MSVSGLAALMFGLVLLAGPPAVVAQRHGGGGGGGAAGTGNNSRSIICLHDCPALRGGLSGEDDLKNFRRSIAVQATEEQRAAFAKILQYTQSAGDQLKDFHEALQKNSASVAPVAPALADLRTALDQAMERVRAGNQNFLDSFSDAQESGLKEITSKLAKEDSDLDKEVKVLGQVIQVSKPDSTQLATSAASLDKKFASFQDEQLVLGREMGILIDAGSQGLAFNLPKVTNAINIAGQTLLIPAWGAVSLVSTENGHDLFSVKLAADLSDLQQNITAIVRSEVARSPRCGERIELRQATLTPLASASLVVANLHYERWVCPPGAASPMEVADSDGVLEVKLTPSVEPNAGLRLVSEINRVNADGLLRDLLRSGDLGVTLREQIAASLLPALQKVADLKATLPPVARESATLQKVQFENAGADQLSLVLNGQLQFSDEQTEQFAAQLKQRLSAQGAPAP
ncbi:MAG TPA: hypothetical protein VJX69_07710 [Terriglobales bacterium]|nr:hypothetical protein [Terriglobales bacterium]